jgi:hypothetical protein
MYNRLVENIVKATEGIFDTEIFKGFQQQYGVHQSKLSDEERKRIDIIMAIPCALPIEDGDVTMSNWLLRISTWGPVKITHTNPEENIKNKTMSPREFLEYVDDQTRNASCGCFNVEETKLNKLRYFRQFADIRGKEITEEIIVEISWRPEIRDQVTKLRKGIKL